MKLITLTNSKRASALISVIIFGAIVSICAAFAYRTTIFQTRMADRSGDYLAALAVAEAGAELAMVELNKEPTATPAAFTGWSGGTNKRLTHTLRDDENQAVGEVVVEVWDLAGEPKIIATGYVPNKANAKIRRSVQLSTKNDTVPSPFGGFGIFAFNKIEMSGNIDFNGNTASGGNIVMGGNSKINGNAQAKGSIITGGNSRVTKKSESNSAPTPPPAIPAPAFSTARPTSNHNNRIELYDNKNNRITVPSSGRKDAHASGNSDMTMPAPGTYHLDTLKLSGNSDLNITGSGVVTIYVESSFDMAGNGKIKTDPGVTLNIISNNDLYMRGNKDIVVQGSNEVNIVTQRMDLGGNAEIEFAGDPKITIWVRESFRMRGNSSINASKNAKPGNLVIFADGAVNISMNGNPEVKGVLYAPTADVNMGGNCEWWGAVLAKTITASGNNNIHADESLLQPTGGTGAYVTAWVERTPVDL